MESLECPSCGLLNPPTNGRCDDCGSNFESRKTGRHRRALRGPRGRLTEASPASVIAICGCGLFLFSPVIALASFLVWQDIPLIPYAVAQGAMEGGASRGYAIYRDLLGRDRSRFRIQDRDDTISCQSFVEVTALRHVGWVAQGQGLVINFEVAVHDWMAPESKYVVRLLYDFEQKTLYGHNDQAFKCEGPADRQRLDETAFQALVDSYE